MKILALSNREGSLDEIVDAFSNSQATVMAKEIKGSTEQLCDEAEEALLKKGYQLVIAATDDYITADIMLNKNRDIRAALCSTRDDAERAQQVKPNVVLMGGNLSVNTLVRLVESIYDLSSGPVQQQQLERRERPVMKREPTPPQQPKKPLISLKHKKKLEDEEEEEQDDEEDEEPRGPARPGLFGKLKDSLGIIEDGQ